MLFKTIPFSLSAWLQKKPETEHSEDDQDNQALNAFKGIDQLFPSTVDFINTAADVIQECALSLEMPLQCQIIPEFEWNSPGCSSVKCSVLKVTGLPDYLVPFMSFIAAHTGGAWLYSFGSESKFINMAKDVDGLRCWFERIISDYKATQIWGKTSFAEQVKLHQSKAMEEIAAKQALLDEKRKKREAPLLLVLNQIQPVLSVYGLKTELIAHENSSRIDLVISSDHTKEVPKELLGNISPIYFEGFLNSYYVAPDRERRSLESLLLWMASEVGTHMAGK